MTHKKRTLQQLFTLMIEKGYYGEDKYNYMCNSLDQACYEGKISLEEKSRAIGAISQWLRDELTVENLIRSRLPECGCTKKDNKLVRIGGLDIYSNWANRPRKSRGSFEAVMAKRIAGWRGLAEKEATG